MTQALAGRNFVALEVLKEILKFALNCSFSDQTEEIVNCVFWDTLGLRVGWVVPNGTR
jgi:hypothetical protein